MTENLSVPPAGESLEKSLPRSRRRRQGGSQILELTLVLLPALMFVFLILDVAWAVYTRAVLQYAVAQGVRYAITSQTVSGLGQRASIQTVVQYNAFGHLNATSGTATGTNGWNSIYVDWYLVNGDGTLTSEDGIVGGNGMQEDGSLPLVAVSVQGLSVNTFMPTIKLVGMTSKLNAVTMAAVSWDRMETPPISNGGYAIPAQ
jgi:Flp pilus assembly protein TadG